MWENIFYTLTGSNGVIGGVTASLDSMHVKAHRSAGGAKGGRWRMRSAGLVVDVPPKFTR